MPPQTVPEDLHLMDLTDSDSDIDVEPDTDVKAHQQLMKDPSESPASVSSRASSVEVIKPAITQHPIPPLHLALGLWCEKTGTSRQTYTRLRQVFSLVTDAALPLKLDTLKRQVRRRIPMLRMMRKALPVVIQKQASFSKKEKNKGAIRKSSWMYWFDPVNLVQDILRATKLRDRMHFGMAEYRDKPTELWHARAWGSSIRSSSGDVVYDRDGEMLIPGDVVMFRQSHGEYHNKGRIIFIGRDFRQTTDTELHGTVVLTVQPVAFYNALTDDLQALVPVPSQANRELYIIEDSEYEIRHADIESHPDVFMDRAYDGEVEQDDAPFGDRFFIRRVLRIHSGTCRFLRRLHPVRGELEVEEFGRRHLHEAFSGENGKRVLSLPFALFVNDFGIHRNSYRALKAFYWIPSALPYDERRKLSNVFTLTLGPHGASMEDVVEAFYRDFRTLDRGGHLMEINGEEVSVCAFSIMLIGDMPQQADNSGFMRHSARFGCRSCFCPSENRSDLTFDITEHGRYHSDTVQARQHLQQLTGQQAAQFTKDTGIRQGTPPMVKLTPALDLILSRTIDVPHSEWWGIGRILQGLLFTSILTKKGANAYLKAFQSFRYPAHWPRIQSPAYYIWSWSLSESGRATILTPLILRSHAHGSWFRFKYLEAAAVRLNPDRRYASSMGAIIWAYRVIAECNSVVGTQRWTDAELIHEWLLKSRHCYQMLIQCAEDAGLGAVADTDAGPSFVGLSVAAGVPGPEQILEQVIADDDADDTEAQAEAEAETGTGSEHEKGSDLGVEISKRNKKGKEAAKPGRRRGKPRGQLSKFEKLLSLPNVHAGLHIADIARESWKAMADVAAPTNLMGYLFAKEMLNQTLRLGFAGSWRAYHPELVEALRHVEDKCPALIQSFQPLTERDDVDEDEAEDATEVQTDETHVAVRMTIGNYKLSDTNNYYNLLARVNLQRLQIQHPFVRDLIASYEVDYGIRRVVDVGESRLKWKERLAYTDPTTRRRWVVSIGDFLMLRGGPAQLAQCCIHTYQRKNRAFLIVNPLERELLPSGSAATDPVLNLDVFSLSRQQQVYGLPALANEIQYYVPARPNGTWMADMADTVVDMDKEYVLEYGYLDGFQGGEDSLFFVSLTTREKIGFNIETKRSYVSFSQVKDTMFFVRDYESLENQDKYLDPEDSKNCISSAPVNQPTDT
ncbi:MAG: hypothetical protein Q9184_004742 [Pyrenodesmia sp. 2 TL-2023]